jgi:hypothetical protein
VSAVALKHCEKYPMHIHKVRPRKDKQGLDLISDVLPFGSLWYGEPNAVSNAIGYAEHRSCSHDAVIRVYDAAGNVIQMHEHKGEFKEAANGLAILPPFKGHFPAWRRK